jgi:HEAT repeat protein
LEHLQYFKLYKDWSADIQKILSLIKPIPPEIKKLIIALRSEDADVSETVSHALGKIGSGAVPALTEAAKDRYKKLRRYVVRVLKKIDTPEAWKALEEYRQKSK